MLGRRAFLAGSGLVWGCRRTIASTEAPVIASSSPPLPSAVADAAPPPRSVHALFEAYPALEKSLPRVALGWFPSRIDQAKTLAPDGRLFVKRDDDFTLGGVPSDSLARLFGGGKVRKLELLLGEARSLGKKRLITVGGVGSNQAVAVAVLGKALGYSVRLHLVPQPPSTLTAKNIAADAATGAELRSFDSTAEAEAEAKRDPDAYVVSAGGTGPLGTLGFVNAGLELAEDVRAKRAPSPKRVYIALGLGGSATGLAIGCALGGLETEIVAVRASNPTTISPATLKKIHDETIAFARARDPSFGSSLPAWSDRRVRIDGRFVGAGYGAPTPAGNEAVTRAGERESWQLDPVYTGKALAALLADLRDGAEGPLLFWNTMSSRPIELAPVPAPFARYAK